MIEHDSAGAEPEIVMQLVAEVLGERPFSAERMRFGHANAVYDVALPVRHVIVKTNRDAAQLAGFVPNHAILSALGLPLPRLIQAGEPGARFPFAFLILEKIPGRDLEFELDGMSHAQMTALAAQIVAYERAVMTLPAGSGFGYVPIGAHGPFRSWREKLQRDLTTDLPPIRDLAPAHLAATLARGLAEFAPEIDAARPLCFLDDRTTKNVIIAGGGLQGIVDIEHVCYGDPLFWLALTRTAVLSSHSERERFYVEELDRLWGATARQRRLINLYALICALDFVHHARREADAPWQDRALRMVRSLLSAVA